MNDSTHKSDNLDEMDRFLETHNLPKFTQEEKNNLDKLIKENGSIIIFPN